MSTVTRLLSLCLDVVEGDDSNKRGVRGKTGLDEEKYFFGKSKEAERDEEGDPQDVVEMALRLIFEVLTGKKCIISREVGL